jgi:hypothetical protein
MAYAAPQGTSYVNAIACGGSSLFIGTQTGVFRASFNGTNWESVPVGLTGRSVQALAAAGAMILARTDDSLFLSTNSGSSWQVLHLSEFTVNDVYALAATGTHFFAGKYYGGLYASTDNGSSWSAVDASLTDNLVRSLAVNGPDLIVGTTNGGVWRRPISELTAVDAGPGGVPQGFFLSQNFPNPFNPITTIRLTLINRQWTIVKLFDPLGREVATLLNEVKGPGTYSVRFDGSHLASGVYYYRLQAGDVVATRKLLLVK